MQGPGRRRVSAPRAPRRSSPALPDGRRHQQRQPGRDQGEREATGPSDLVAALAALHRMGLADLADRPFTTLSGGQRQLVLIARAIAQDSPYLLLDEPTASLDFGNQLLVWDAVRSLADDGRAALVCSHDPNHALWFADDVVVLGRDGSVTRDGPADEVIDAGSVAGLYGFPVAGGRIAGRPVVVPTGRADATAERRTGSHHRN